MQVICEDFNSNVLVKSQTYEKYYEVKEGLKHHICSSKPHGKMTFKEHVLNCLFLWQRQALKTMQSQILLTSTHSLELHFTLISRKDRTIK